MSSASKKKSPPRMDDEETSNSNFHLLTVLVPSLPVPPEAVSSKKCKHGRPRNVSGEVLDVYKIYRDSMELVAKDVPNAVRKGGLLDELLPDDAKQDIELLSIMKILMLSRATKGLLSFYEGEPMKCAIGVACLEYEIDCYQKSGENLGQQQQEVTREKLAQKIIAIIRGGKTRVTRFVAKRIPCGCLQEMDRANNGN